MRKLLLDSSVFFTAVNSPTGGSAKLFTLSKLRLYTTPLILTEVERNVRKKLALHHLERFFILAEKLAVQDLKPDLRTIDKAKKVIAKKDAPILADAKNANIDALVTLDKKDFLKPEVIKFIRPKKILTPKEFLNSKY